MSTRDYIFSAAFYIVVHRMGKIINDGILSQQTTSCDGDEFSFWECQLSANRFYYMIKHNQTYRNLTDLVNKVFFVGKFW